MSKRIKTDRLVLRPFLDADAETVAALIGNLEVARWLTRVPHPYTPDDAHEFFARDAGDAQVCAITLSDQVIGGCSIENELGYWLGQPYWGHGYGSEAAHALVSRHFNAGHADLTSGYIMGNAASERVLSKLGFVPAQIEDTQCVSLDRIVPVQKMTLSLQDWRTRA